MAIISDKSLTIIRTTAPIVKEHAEAITTCFYPKMLGRHPDLFRYFNETNQRTGVQAKAFGDMITGQGNDVNKSSQAKTLADAIVAYATNIEHLERLSEAVGRMCHKHAALGVQPADYQIVHDNLMEAIGDVLGEAATEEVAAAWSEAIMALASICIQTENKLYRQAAAEQWVGCREFEISEIIDETSEIKSIRMKPTDGKGTCPFKPGQYISVYERPDGRKYFAPRHYTVTSQPGLDYYQVTVKKMILSDHDGIMSSYLHSKQVGDTLKLGPVFGPPSLDLAKPGNVIAFVTVGVGVTPAIAMLPTAMKDHPQVAVFHGDRSCETMPFKAYLEDVIPQGRGILNLSFSSGLKEDTGSPYVSEGRLTAKKIVDVLTKESIDYQNGVDYFICAGNTTTPIVKKELLEAGVDSERIHLEFFGPFITSIGD